MIATSMIMCTFFFWGGGGGGGGVNFTSRDLNRLVIEVTITVLDENGFPIVDLIII